MFCDQCEQTAHGTGCVTSPGVCGKTEEVQALQELLLYGAKGMAAYAHHARKLGRHDEGVAAFLERALFATMTNVNFDPESLFALCLECGRHNYSVMEMLDAAHVAAFGAPAPTEVREGTEAGPGVLVTGHDLYDLNVLLHQIEGTDIKVYTHGEMLPAHMYPALEGHPNLAGHFGGAWQEQKWEFASFGGPIVATTNCVLIPRESYAERLFTTGVTAVPGATLLPKDDYSQVIDKARECDPLPEVAAGRSTIGFHHSVLAGKLDALIDAVKQGQVSKFFLIGGCDGAERGRNYFSDFAQSTPKDTFILTLGCGKYRLRGYDYGTLLGLPRLLDMGQCNDAYGALRVASALARAFECSVNDLPLELVVSWFEQKAVAVLLTLLSLGVKGIQLGPKPPGFLTPAMRTTLEQRYGLRFTRCNGQGHLDVVQPQSLS
ncbi:MAG: hydroxylamine reductase [Proteobacteria bacterium]|nr:hydroxylamine reductase [Pseudomonadota bacterium]